MEMMSLRLSADDLDRATAEARRRGISRSALVRRALHQVLDEDSSATATAEGRESGHESRLAA